MSLIAVQPLNGVGSVASWLGGIIDTGLTSAVAPTISNVTDYVLLIFIPAAVISIAYFGWTVMNGTAHRPAGELMQIFFKLVVIAAILTKGGYYADTLSTAMLGMPDEIMSAVSGSNSGQLSQIDNSINQSAQAATATQARAPNSLTSPVQGFLFAAVSFGFTIIGAVFGGIAAVVLTVMKVGMALTVMMGPFFIAAAFFKITRKYFDHWKDVALFFAIAGALFMLVLTLALQMMAAAATGIINALTGSGDVNILSLFAAFFVVTMASVFMLGISLRVATKLTDGISINLPFFQL